MNVKYIKIADQILFLSFVIALFCLLTNLIPLIQLDLISPLKSKSRYANTTRITFVIFFALLAVFSLRWKNFTQQSIFVQSITRTGIANPVFWIIAMSIYYGVSAFAVGVARHIAVETRAFDLGIFTQAIWNTLQGDILFSSIKENVSLLGDHFQPLQLLTVPVYMVWPSPLSLLAVQAICMTLCIPLIYIYACDITGDRKVALVFSLAFFLFLPSRGVLHEDYHPEILAQPLMFAAFIFYHRGRNIPALLTLTLILLAKENMCGIVFCAGLYLILFKRKFLIGTVFIIFSIAYFWIITHLIIPGISGLPYLYTGNFNNNFADPLLLFKQLLSGDTISYIGKLFMPFGFLSFLHPPTLLFCLPVLMQNLLSENEAMRSFNFHYTIGLTPFVIISAIQGFQALKQKFKLPEPKQNFVLVLIILLSLVRTGPSEYYYLFNSSNNINSHKNMISKKLRMIDKDKVVLTHNNLIPQTINRKYVYQFEYNHAPTKAEQALKYDADIIITEEEFWEPKSLDTEQTYRQLEEAGYHLIFWQDSFRMYSK